MINRINRISRIDGIKTIFGRSSTSAITNFIKIFQYNYKLALLFCQYKGKALIIQADKLQARVQHCYQQGINAKTLFPIFIQDTSLFPYSPASSNKKQLQIQFAYAPRIYYKNQISQSYSQICAYQPSTTGQQANNQQSLEQFRIASSSSMNKTSPFLPPFEKGRHVCDLLPNHRLLYNKYYIYKHQLLITSRLFQPQSSRLNLQDFKQIAHVMQSMSLSNKKMEPEKIKQGTKQMHEQKGRMGLVWSGSFMYNCGKNSGFSQPHKHIQQLPEQSLKLPIISNIIAAVKQLCGQQNPHKAKETQKLLYQVERNKNTQTDPQTKIYNYKHFNFVHAIVLLHWKTLTDSKSECTKDKIAAALKHNQQILYNYVCGQLNRIRSKGLGVDKDVGYNVIGCDRFLLIVPRSNEYISARVGQLQQKQELIGLNSLAFMGAIHFESKLILQAIKSKYGNSVNILKQITFQKV